jgi:hypothetical protein
LAAFAQPAARAQAIPTATQALQLSAFAGGSYVQTGLDNGKNVGVTAGANLGFRPLFSLSPSLAVRGMFPMSEGKIDGLAVALVGAQLERRFGRFHPYGNILFGRGQVNYVQLTSDPTYRYVYKTSTSNVLSPGGGIDVDITHFIALKADGQYQKWSSPVTLSGQQYVTAITIGAVYRFDFNQSRRKSK